MTIRAPASASIAALTSPVNAPEASAAQSCAPTTIAEPATVSARRAMRVEGGQMATRAAAGASRSAPAISRASPRSAARPFIFQLPAISGIPPLPLDGASGLLAPKPLHYTASPAPSRRETKLEGRPRNARRVTRLREIPDRRRVHDGGHHELRLRRRARRSAPEILQRRGDGRQP